MPTFENTTTSAAPVEEVWKLLYDPLRFPEWWVGMETVQPEGTADGEFTYFPTGYPDFPMPQQLSMSRDQRRVMVSCLVSDLRFEWRLEPIDGDATRIKVRVEIPPEEAQRLDVQRDVIRRSLERLAELATA